MNLEFTQNTGLINLYNNVEKILFGGNPFLLVVVTVILVLYFLLFSNLVGGSLSTNQVSPSTQEGLGILQVILWGFFIFLIVINGLQYFLQVDIKTVIRNIFTPKPEIDITVMQDLAEGTTKEKGLRTTQGQKQVFHIRDNEYTYDDARALCKAYGARLATYNEIEESYKNGGEWCSYGWSQDQLALFPTQIDTFEKLKVIPGHEHDCGRPGVNGGFIANKNVKFGVNCYGYKPRITPNEIQLMETATPFPLTERDKRFQRRVNQFKQNIPDILIAPFSNERWSQM